MRALFLGDAHLNRPEDNNYQSMLAFLREQTGHVDLLVFLGDIFEFWAGDRNRLFEHYVPLINCLETMVKSGTKLTYVEGNHDYDLGRQFTERLKCKVLPDGGTLELGGKKIFISHGDQTNPADKKYLALRWFLRTPLMRFVTRRSPEWLVTLVADYSVKSSRTSSNDKRRRWPVRKILLPYAREKIAEGYSIIITGHYHYPFRECLENGELIALGDWIEQFSYLAYEEGKFELRTYSPNS